MDAIVYDKVGKEAEKVREALYGIYPQAPITDAAIASFDDGADGIPVKKLVANIEPQQNLHGYESPWPAGSGKNKLPLNLADIKSITTYGSWSGNKYTFRGITWTIDIDDAGNVVGITANGTAEQETNISIVLPFDIDGSYSLSGCPTGGDGYSTYNMRILNESTNEVIASDYGNGSTFTATNRIKARITIYAGYTASNLKFYPMLRPLSITDPTFAPYSNICPISGWTGAEIRRTGKNLLDSFNRVTSHANRCTITISVDGGITATSTNPLGLVWAGYWEVKNVRAGAKVKLVNISNISGGYVREVDQNGTIVKSVAMIRNNQVYTVVNDNVNLQFRFDFGSNIAEGTQTTIYPMVVAESVSDATYEPYVGSPLSVTFPSSAGTVYGGTLTINPDRTGTLVVDMNIEELVWGNGYAATDLNGITRKGFSLRQIINRSKRQISVSDIAPYAADAWDLSAVHFDVGGTGGQQAFAWLPTETNPETIITIAYPIANPVTYQLTASEISAILTTLYGTNNIWADTGNIEELTYRADFGKYIDSHITTAVANALNA